MLRKVSTEAGEPTPEQPRRPARGAPEHGFRPDIEGLRAVAVLLVVLSHAGVGRVAGGYVGVDVFFVISGFLITSLLLRELAATDTLSITRFYARRALRLLPLSTLVAVVTLAGAWLYLSKVRFAEYTSDALTSVLYLVNVRLAATGTDYLAEGAPPSPYRHYWSLAVEEQFYLVWPLLLLLSWCLVRWCRRLPGLRDRAGAGLLGVPLAAVCLVSLWQSVTVTPQSPPWAYFGAHTRFWELGAGALLALSVDRLRRLPAPAAAALTWIGLAGIVLAALRYDERTPFPGHHALLPVLGAVLVVAGGCRPTGRGAGLLLGRRPMVRIGALSYGWYLWHWPLLLVGPAVLGRSGSVRLSLLLCAAALVLAWATYHLVENPVRFHPRLRHRPRRSLTLGLGLSGAAAALTLVAAAFPPPIAAGGKVPTLRGALTSAADPRAALGDLLETSGDRLPANLDPSLREVKATRSRVYDDGCHVGYSGSRSPACAYGDPAADRTVVLFGDSHAAQWFPALERLAEERGWRLYSLTKAACKVADLTTVKLGRAYTSCDAWREDSLARIEELEPDLVIASASDAGRALEPEFDPVRQWADGYAETFRRLADTGARVAYLLDTPWPRSDAVECAAAHPMRLDRCAHRLPDAFEDPDRRAAIADAGRASGVLLVDPAPWLCTASGHCPVVAGDTFVYRDANHISEAYAEALTPVLGARLTTLLGPSWGAPPPSTA